MSKPGLPRRIGGAALLAGLMLLLLGLYYLMVRAGLPYQDPTPEMQIRYAVHQGVGSALIRLGAGSTALGAVLRLIFRPNK